MATSELALSGCAGNSQVRLPCRLRQEDPVWYYIAHCLRNKDMDCKDARSRHDLQSMVGSLTQNDSSLSSTILPQSERILEKTNTRLTSTMYGHTYHQAD